MDYITTDPRPRHVAIIMDGNGRWAQKRGLPRTIGHRRGVQALKTSVRFCKHNGIDMLTVYAFSTENWHRPRKEVQFLMSLFKSTFENEIDELHEEGVRIRWIGEPKGVSEDVARVWNAAEELTANNNGVVLNIAFNYGARQELVLACQAAATAVKNGQLKIEDIDEVLLGEYLYTKACPDPDLLIRTGGELRLSNFLLWQVAYTELYVTETLWPDFSEKDFEVALQEFQRRHRKFGRLDERDDG